MKVSTVAYVPVSEVFNQATMDIVAESGNVTWGQADHSLYSRDMLIVEVQKYRDGTDDEEEVFTLSCAIDALGDLPDGVYIDMEN